MFVLTLFMRICFTRELSLPAKTPVRQKGAVISHHAEQLNLYVIVSKSISGANIKTNKNVFLN